MLAPKLVLALGLLVGAALAGPAHNDNRLGRRSFTVSAHAKDGQMDGAAALRNAYLKYGGIQPQPDTSVEKLSIATGELADQGDSDEVTASPSNQYDSSYTAPVTVGGQTLNMNVDTGSSDFWVYSSEIDPSKLNDQTTFNYSQSSTFEKMDGYSFSIGYGDGSSSLGFVGTDVVDIGGLDFEKQAFGVATKVKGTFLDCDGLVGLGYPMGDASGNTITPVPQKTFFANVLPSLKLPVFTADLGKTTGTYEFGAINASKFIGELLYAPIDTSTSFWRFSTPSFKIGDTTWTWLSAPTAIIDTGTTFLLMDPVLVNAYYNHVAGATYHSSWEFPCTATLPPLSLAIGPAGFAAINPANLLFAPSSTHPGMCTGALQYAADTSPGQILGGPFLKSQFVVFDAGNARVGAAPKA